MDGVQGYNMLAHEWVSAVLFSLEGCFVRFGAIFHGLTLSIPLTGSDMVKPTFLRPTCLGLLVVRLARSEATPQAVQSQGASFLA